MFPVLLARGENLPHLHIEKSSEKRAEDKRHGGGGDGADNHRATVGWTPPLQWWLCAHEARMSVDSQIYLTLRDDVSTGSGGKTLPGPTV